MRQKIDKLNCLETNPQNQDLFTTADDLRAKFKQVINNVLSYVSYFIYDIDNKFYAAKQWFGSNILFHKISILHKQLDTLLHHFFIC